VLVLGLNLSYLAFGPNSLGAKAHHDLLLIFHICPKTPFSKRRRRRKCIIFSTMILVKPRHGSLNFGWARQEGMGEKHPSESWVKRILSLFLYEDF